jgi:biotin operon repressor
VKWVDALKSGAKFTRAPHGAEHIDNLTAIRVYVTICRMMNNKSGQCWKSQAGIAAHLNIGERAVGKACRWLQKNGYISRVRATGRTGWAMIPLDVPDEPAEKRDTGERLMDENGKFIRPGSAETTHVRPLSRADANGSREPSKGRSAEPTMNTKHQTQYQTQERTREARRPSHLSVNGSLPFRLGPIGMPGKCAKCGKFKPALYETDHGFMCPEHSQPAPVEFDESDIPF